MPIRPASRPSRPRPKKTAPSSISASAVCSTADQPRLRILAASSSPSFVPTTTSRSPAVRMKSGLGRRVHLPGAHHRDDGDAGAGAQRGVAERAPVERGALVDRELPGVEARQVAVLLVEVGDQLRRAEQVGQRARLVVGQRQLGERTRPGRRPWRRSARACRRGRLTTPIRRPARVRSPCAHRSRAAGSPRRSHRPP